MTDHTIKLTKGEWHFDDAQPIGDKGGFGEVFHGRGPEGNVAIKRLHVGAQQAAYRELRIAEELQSRDLSYVVPIFDSGQDAESDRYFLVMPLCEGSLQQHLDKSGGPIDRSVVKRVLKEVANGLHEVQDIVHRDLKPGNVLYHEGAWKVADFGIAKFIEESTSTETLRRALTPPYAAPEQWTGEEPTSATDIYALGCIAYALLTGSPPFSGSIDEIRNQHLRATPPSIQGLPAATAAFLAQMLRKSPSARPTLKRCVSRLSELSLDKAADAEEEGSLEAAAQHVADADARAEAERQQAAADRAERAQLYKEAVSEVERIIDQLFARIRGAYENVDEYKRRGRRLRFGQADVGLERVPEELTTSVARAQARGERLYQSTGWDVVGWATMSVRRESGGRGGAYTWSASLLYADLGKGDGYRWYEMAFWSMGEKDGRDEPFGLEGYDQHVDLAAGPGVHSVQVAYGPSPIDAEDEPAFLDRWIDLVAKAAMGELKRPTGMPVNWFVKQ